MTIKGLSAPVAIAVIGALTLGVGGTAAAGHLITGKDIKNGSITKKDLSAATVKKFTPKPQTHWYGAHIDILNENANSEGFATPVGWTASESSTPSFVEAISGPTNTKLVSMVVHLQSAPGAGATRSFYLVVNGVKSSACVIADSNDTCAVTENFTVTKNRLIYLESDVGSVAAGGADAAIGWSTVG